VLFGVPILHLPTAGMHTNKAAAQLSSAPTARTKRRRS
jgi:hypothetical protein